MSGEEPQKSSSSVATKSSGEIKTGGRGGGEAGALPIMVLVEVVDDYSASREILAPADKLEALGGLATLTNTERNKQLLRTMLLSKEWQPHRLRLNFPSKRHVILHRTANAALVRVAVWKADLGLQ